MTTPVQQKIRDKKKTPQQIADMVRSGDWINHGTGGGDSTVCTDAVARRLGPGPGDLKDIELWMYANRYPHWELQEIDPLQQYLIVVGPRTPLACYAPWITGGTKPWQPSTVANCYRQCCWRQ